MKNCNECGKKLKMLDGYKHPIKGKKYLVCSPCFDMVEEEVARNRQQILLETRSAITPRQTTKQTWSDRVALFNRMKSQTIEELPYGKEKNF